MHCSAGRVKDETHGEDTQVCMTFSKTIKKLMLGVVVSLGQYQGFRVAGRLV